jgi:hypothetical protein
LLNSFKNLAGALRASLLHHYNRCQSTIMVSCFAFIRENLFCTFVWHDLCPVFVDAIPHNQSHPGDRCAVKNAAQGNIHLDEYTDPGNCLGGTQRISANLEEGVSAGEPISRDIDLTGSPHRHRLTMEIQE